MFFDSYLDGYKKINDNEGFRPQWGPEGEGGRGDIAKVHPRPSRVIVQTRALVFFAQRPRKHSILYYSVLWTIFSVFGDLLGPPRPRGLSTDIIIFFLGSESASLSLFLAGRRLLLSVRCHRPLFTGCVRSGLLASPPGRLATISARQLSCLLWLRRRWFRSVSSFHSPFCPNKKKEGFPSGNFSLNSTYVDF